MKINKTLRIQCRTSPACLPACLSLVELLLVLLLLLGHTARICRLWLGNLLFNPTLDLPRRRR